ncbi:MAG: HlyD family efflux transporter periplasmic adaptor subunit [Dehalococcoidales bacterium]|jgi:macrolide-specific efflux system membrane fusion protein
MKFLKILVAMLLVGVIVASAASCGSSKNTAAKTQEYTVAPGNISVDIAAAGNLALSTVQDLTFDLFYKLGTISSVNVTVGDTVTKGEVLASLDPTEWNGQIQVLQDALTSAQRDVTNKEQTLATTQRTVATQTRLIATKQEAVATAQRQVTASQLQLQQAQIDVQSANNTLNKISNVKTIQDRIDHDNFVIQYATLGANGEFARGTPNNSLYWTGIIGGAQADLALAQQDMVALLGGANPYTSADVATQVAQDLLQIQVKQLALVTAQVAVGDTQTAVDDANTALANAQQDLTFDQQSVTNAQQDLTISNQKETDAQNSLAEAQAASPDIVAPFNGFVTKVNNAGGDQVYAGAVIIEVADPNKFEANILVSEMDISKVTVGGSATVAVDATSGTYPAKVTQIAPTATISSGVVNYSVVVTLTSTTPINLNSSFPAVSGNNTAQLSQLLQNAVKAGRITQAQADETLKNAASGNFTLPPGLFPSSGNFTLPNGAASGNGTLPGGFSGSAGGTRRSQTSSVAATNAQLRQGMTVTVSVIVASRTNVLVVPNGAITTANGQNTVEVVTANTTLEKRTVQTGLSDLSNTEITSGLTAGEKISIPLTAKSTTTSTSQTRGGVGIPFIGR